VHIKHVLGHLAASQVAGKWESGRGKGFWFPLKMPLTMATCAGIVTSLSKIKEWKKENWGPDV